MKIPKKTTTKAYRLDLELAEGLKKAALRKGISENAYVHNLLAQRIKADLLIHAFPYVVISRSTLLPILGSTNPDGLEIAGLDLGKRNFTLAREIYHSVGKELSFFEYLVEILDKQARWFEVTGAEDKPERLTLRHECGIKWSLFVRGYLTGAFEVMSKERIKITLNESYVSMEFPMK